MLEVWSPALKFWTHRVLTSSLPQVVASPSQVCSCLLPVQSGRRTAPSWATSGRVLQPSAARSAHRHLGLRLRGLYEVEQLAVACGITRGSPAPCLLLSLPSEQRVLVSQQPAALPGTSRLKYNYAARWNPAGSAR